MIGAGHIKKSLGGIASILQGAKAGKGIVKGALGFAASNPELAMGAIGGASGFIASGGSVAGTFLGFSAGAIYGGRKNPWDPKRGGFMERGARRLAMKGLPTTEKLVGGKFIKATMAPIPWGKIKAYSRGMKAGSVALGTGLVGGVGSAAMGGAWGHISSAMSGRASPGSTYGSERRSHYGASFSGMGNGTVMGY